ncbi:hypothetical protein COV23_01160 [Candidatus Wolfebacteria bacterium CG10_big_fil_rev_8_21_14_0_10_31_9]|uniref:SHS2 domain-containing protein n=1 Tax=Candidatus Wolfebacteria bacterium CG10_big_fil_rev_8_21_14_0_10_31_9 TaxID=1975070 RepID=A0A2H0RCB8_9BACT|nr:MAG: hypothetical protein COV23_01160 [Candidatus Wolfebacteria bacterium CG10_big_fil_rev_8_21_14_0_10_31_9]
MNIKTFINLISPQPEVAGLEISDAYIRFIFIKGKKAEFFSSKLPPGIVEDGRVKDKEGLISILSNFHKKISSNGGKFYVVLSISDSNIYTEIFTLPISALSNLNEAAQLNLQMISPIDFISAYSDWQVLREDKEEGTNQFGVLGAFSSKQVIDDFEEVLSKSGFEPVATEFPMFALSRALVELGDGISNEKNYLLLRVGSDGLSFGLIKNGDMFFLHFISWSAIYGGERTVSINSLRKVIVEETQKVLSFHETHTKGDISDFILVSPSLVDEISKVVSENFPKLSLKIPTLNQFTNLTPAWFSALGSALRGTISRSKDNIISLSKIGTENKFMRYQVDTFIKIWRSIIFSVFGGVFLLYLIMDGIFANNLSGLNNQSSNVLSDIESAKLTELVEASDDFNQKANMLYYASSEKIKWSVFLNDINNKTGGDIIINKLLIQSLASPVLIIGQAPSQEAIVNFKNALSLQPQISDINFQPSSVTQSGNKLNFSISFNIRDISGF